MRGGEGVVKRLTTDERGREIRVYTSTSATIRDGEVYAFGWRARCNTVAATGSSGTAAFPTCSDVSSSNNRGVIQAASVGPGPSGGNLFHHFSSGQMLRSM